MSLAAVRGGKEDLLAADKGGGPDSVGGGGEQGTYLLLGKKYNGGGARRAEWSILVLKGGEGERTLLVGRIGVKGLRGDGSWELKRGGVFGSIDSQNIPRPDSKKSRNKSTQGGSFARGHDGGRCATWEASQRVTDRRAICVKRT